MEAKTKPSLLNLPTELLDKIFSFLKTQDIRKIRRVNKRLNEIANQSIYCENEIFHWNEVNNTRPVVKLLNRSKRSVFNLHFDSVNFEDDSVMSFFQKHGSKVHSLSFYDCNFPRRLIQNMILNCTALRSFSYITSKDFHRLNKFDGFGKFKTRSIVREEVTSLTFAIGRLFRKDMDGIEPTLRRFMSIFPNVTRLDIRIPNAIWSYKKSKYDYPQFIPGSDNSSGTCEICGTQNIMRSAAIYKSILHMSKNLQWLRTDLSFDFLSEIGELFLEDLPNLIYLSLDLGDFYAGEMDVSRWRTSRDSFPLLEILNRYNSMADVVQKLNPKLFEIRKWTSWPPVMDSNVFMELLRSDVKTLKFTSSTDWTVDPIHLLHSPNATLTDLHIPMCSFAINFTPVALFIEHFQALAHLRLEVVSNEILQLIFNHQKNLRSLYLEDCQKCDLDGFAGAKDEKQLSIRELHNLEHLTIKKIKVSMLESRHFIDAFQFPRLKYLFIEADYVDIWKKKRSSSSRRIPIALFESMTNLEALSLSCLGKASFEELKALCQNLKNLRYLDYYCYGFYHNIDRVCIVDLSESTFKDLQLENDQSYYDDIMKKVVLIEDWAGFTLFSPKISSFVIDWMTF